jgi:hypothetical protein
VQGDSLAAMLRIPDLRATVLAPIAASRASRRLRRGSESFVQALRDGPKTVVWERRADELAFPWREMMTRRTLALSTGRPRCRLQHNDDRPLTCFAGI